MEGLDSRRAQIRHSSMVRPGNINDAEATTQNTPMPHDDLPVGAETLVSDARFAQLPRQLKNILEDDGFDTPEKRLELFFLDAEDIAHWGLNGYLRIQLKKFLGGKTFRSSTAEGCPDAETVPRDEPVPRDGSTPGHRALAPGSTPCPGRGGPKLSEFPNIADRVSGWVPALPYIPDSLTSILFAIANHYEPKHRSDLRSWIKMSPSVATYLGKLALYCFNHRVH